MQALHEEKLQFLEEKAAQLRYDPMAMVIRAGSGHIAGPLGMADIFAALYFHILNHDPARPEGPERDR